jgi:hypothetical protein
MKRNTPLALVIGLTAMPSWLLAQSLQTPGIASNSGAIQGPGQGQGAQLVLWSQAQKAQRVPIPFPLSRPTGRARPPNSQPQQQVLVGTIERAGGRYVLRMANPSTNQSPLLVQLDDQQKASRYEGRQVKLTGTMDEPQSYVQVDSIELIS